jgi:hypothetical protein
MVDYASIAERIFGGLTGSGAAATMTLRRTTTGAFDPAAGTYASSVDTDYTVYGLIQARSLYQTGAVGQNFFNGVLVQTDDQFVLLAAHGLAITPAAGDILVVNGVAHTVATMIPVGPGGTALMYRILARR